jgi:hypothetical protein
MTTSTTDMQLSAMPTVQESTLIRRKPDTVFAAFVDPAITTRFWFTNGTLRRGRASTLATREQVMTADEEAIRSLIERWVDAVHSPDLDGVLADHAPNIVTFDVPPTYNGVRGIDAYRATWPTFLE